MEGSFGTWYTIDTANAEARFQRLKALHELLKRVFGSNYDGPVVEVLSQEGATGRIVDLCTGTGLWCVLYFRLRFDTHTLQG